MLIGFTKYSLLSVQYSHRYARPNDYCEDLPPCRLSFTLYSATLAIFFPACGFHFTEA